MKESGERLVIGIDTTQIPVIDTFQFVSFEYSIKPLQMLAIAVHVRNPVLFYVSFNFCPNSKLIGKILKLFITSSIPDMS
jgi:hypothetical protein